MPVAIAAPALLRLLQPVLVYLSRPADRTAPAIEPVPAAASVASAIHLQHRRQLWRRQIAAPRRPLLHCLRQQQPRACGQPRTWCRKRFRSFPIVRAQPFAMNIWRPPTIKRWRSHGADRLQHGAGRRRHRERAALDTCQQRADALAAAAEVRALCRRRTVVYTHARPPMPPTPWVTADPSIERPLVPGEIPLLRDNGKATIATTTCRRAAPKASALGPLGDLLLILFNQESADEAIRRALELCGNNAGVPCLVVAVNNDFVVPIPTTMKATGFFRRRPPLP